jgi:hypothetical protein
MPTFLLGNAVHLTRTHSIIIVAAIGASPTDAWETKSKTATTQHPMWITRDLREKIPEARVLVYSGLEVVTEGDRLATLARKLLDALAKLRKYEVSN